MKQTSVISKDKIICIRKVDTMHTPRSNVQQFEGDRVWLQVDWKDRNIRVAFTISGNIYNSLVQMYS